MRLKLLLRRLTVSAPHMAVRSALPWPLRWVLFAVVAGFCAAIALWAFELGKDLAGLDRGVKTQLAQAQADLASMQQRLDSLQGERDQAQAVANTAQTLMTAEKVAQARLIETNEQLQQEIQRLRGDLGFFEKWVQAPGQDAGLVSVRGLHTKLSGRGKLDWQVLVVQSAAAKTPFKGKLELVMYGVLRGKAWSHVDAQTAKNLSFERYARVSGVYAVPSGVRLSKVTAKVYDGQKLVAEYTARL